MQLAQTRAQTEAISSRNRFEQQQDVLDRRLMEIQEKDILRRGEEEAEGHMQKVRRLIGSQRAALAAQGIDVGVGTAVDIVADTEAQGEIDAAKIRNNAYREAFGYKVEALRSRTASMLKSTTARAQRRSTALTGGLKFARTISSGLYQFDRMGGFGG